MPYNYGNYTPGCYQTAVGTPNPPYQQTWQPMPQQPSYNYSQGSGNNSIIWVQGEAAAKAYPVGPGQSVLLMDSEESVLYVKSTDMSGRPMPMEIYDLVKRDSVISSQAARPQIQQQVDNTQYVKLSELEAKVEELVNKALEK